MNVREDVSTANDMVLYVRAISRSLMSYYASILRLGRLRHSHIQGLP